MVSHQPTTRRLLAGFLIGPLVPILLLCGSGVVDGSTHLVTALWIAFVALLFVAWLTANPDARSDYLNVKRAAEKAGGTDTAAYVEVKEPWFLDAYRRAWEWADSTGWKP